MPRMPQPLVQLLPEPSCPNQSQEARHIMPNANPSQATCPVDNLMFLVFILDSFAYWVNSEHVQANLLYYPLLKGWRMSV